MMPKPKLYLACLFAASAAVAVVEVVLNLKGAAVSDKTQLLWALIFFIGGL